MRTQTTGDSSEHPTQNGGDGGEHDVDAAGPVMTWFAPHVSHPERRAHNRAEGHTGGRPPIEACHTIDFKDLYATSANRPACILITAFEKPDTTRATGAWFVNCWRD